MDFGLRGKVAMVAASSKGIGLATARVLAEEGCILSICGRTEASLEAAIPLIGDDTRSYVVDVTNPDDLAWWHEQTVQDLGPVSVLVTNTGGPPAGALSTLTEEQWALGFQSTLMNVVRMVNVVAPSMAEAGWGRIVHVTSLVAKQPNDILPISSTLRAGLLALTQLQARQYAAQGVTVNGILPGHTLTDRQLHLASIRSQRDGITPEEALRRQGEEVPVGRLATPEEIGAAIAFLCSQQAAYITGTSTLVDGGLNQGLA